MGKQDILVDLTVLIKAGMPFASIQASGQRDGELAYQPMVRDAKVAQLQRETNEMCNTTRLLAEVDLAIE